MEGTLWLPQQWHVIPSNLLIVGPAFIFLLENEPKHASGLRQGYLSMEVSDAGEMASSYLTRRVKGKAVLSTAGNCFLTVANPFQQSTSWSFALLQTFICLFFNSTMSIHSFDAFGGKPLTEKVYLNLWLMVYIILKWNSCALFLTYEVQPADTNWSSPCLQPYGHRGFQLKLSQTHLEDGENTLNHL